MPPIIQPGDEVTVKPQNPLTSTTVQGVIVWFVFWMIRKFGWHISMDLAKDSVDTVFAIAQNAVGPFMILWGRWKASRPLGLSATPVTVVVKCLLPFLLLPFLGGCAGMTPLQRISAARQTYTVTLDSLTALSKAGLIQDQRIKDTLYDVRIEAHQALDAAEEKAVAGDGLGFSFVMQRVNSALDKLIQMNITARKSGPATEPRVWIPSPSLLSPYSSPPRPPDSLGYCRSTIPARRSPMRIAA